MKTPGPMGTPALLLLLCATPAFADTASDLCAANPAYAQPVMLAIVRAQLQRDHDPALDADTPEKLADQAVAQGVSECAAEVRADPTIAASLSGLDKTDATVGWDAYNTSCADRKASRGPCITAEIGSAHALKRMIATDTPAGAKTLVQACELVMQADPAMADWRQCVDTGLAVHATPARAQQCKLSANWHVAKTGADAGQIIATCLRGG